jgi:hypothetical protein
MADERDPDFAGRARHAQIKFKQPTPYRFLNDTHRNGGAPAGFLSTEGALLLEFRSGSRPSVDCDHRVVDRDAGSRFA